MQIRVMSRRSSVSKGDWRNTINKLQSRMIFAIICRIRKKFAYLHQKKVLLGSEGPGSTKAVYVAQAGLFYFFIGVPELRRRKYSSGKCDSVLKNL